jgi:hypothetical protein
MRDAITVRAGVESSLSAQIRGIDLNYRRRMLEIEINEFAAAVADVSEGRRCRRAGNLVPRELQQRAFRDWDRDIGNLLKSVPPPRDWKPLSKLRAASKRLLEWMDGTVLTARPGGASLQSFPGESVALAPRSGPLRERELTGSQSYYDDPLHDK